LKTNKFQTSIRIVLLSLSLLVIILFQQLHVSKLAETSIFMTSYGYVLFFIAGLITTLLMSKITTRAHEWLEWLSFISLSAMLVMILFTFFLLPSNVTQSSMFPTLENGDRILVYHFNYEPSRNDIIVLQVNQQDYPLVPQTSFIDQETGRYEPIIYFVKRVYALPGDTIRFFEAEEREGLFYIFVNDKVTLSPTNQYYTVTESQKNMLEASLINGLLMEKYLVMGDNSTASLDSRNIGFVSEEDLMGKVIYKLWPFGGVS
jgi:signal peptidase I